jgi:hypothetical protein
MTDRYEPGPPSNPLAEPGLARQIPRRARRVIAGHEQLQTFSELVRSAVEQGSLHNARLSFTRLCDALDAHITVEDHHFFPAMRGLKPEIAAELAQLIREHAAFRLTMEALHDLLAQGSAEAFAMDFEVFCDELADHEFREEQLIKRATPKYHSPAK